MPNIIDQMEVHIFAAQLARLSRLTGKTANADFIREMYERVKDRYVEELQNRKIRLRTLDGARLDEIVSYIYYYHIFHTSHLPEELTKKLESDEKYREMLVRDVAVYIVIIQHLNAFIAVRRVDHFHLVLGQNLAQRRCISGRFHGSASYFDTVGRRPGSPSLLYRICAGLTTHPSPGKKKQIFSEIPCKNAAFVII